VRIRVGDKERVMGEAGCLGLKLGIAEAVSLLEYEEFHRDHFIVGSASLGAFIVVVGLGDGSEGLPIYEGFHHSLSPSFRYLLRAFWSM